MSAFDEKWRKYERDYGGKDNILPFVMNYEGVIFGESLKLMRNWLPEVDIGKVYASIYAEIAIAWTDASDLFTRKVKTAREQGTIVTNSKD